MTPPTIKYGAFVPQGWKLEYSGVDAASAWARSREIAQLAERLGYDHLWVYDHVETVPRREPTHVFEAFTTLAAVAQITQTIALGQLVTCAAYRNAGLLAKEAACVDVFSGGRLIFGIGAGWYEREYQAYGYEFPPATRRLQILDETITVVKRLWTEAVTPSDVSRPKARAIFMTGPATAMIKRCQRGWDKNSAGSPVRGRSSTHSIS